MEAIVSKLTEENAALRDKLQKMEGQFNTLKNIDYYQAFIAQRSRADGLKLQYDNALCKIGKLNGRYESQRGEWGTTVERLHGQLTSAQAEITSLKSQLQKLNVSRPAAAAPQENRVHLTDLRL